MLVNDYCVVPREGRGREGGGGEKWWGSGGAYGKDGDAAALGDGNVSAVICGDGVGGGGLEMHLGRTRATGALEGVTQEQSVGLLGRGLRGEGVDCFEVGGVFGAEVEIHCFGELSLMLVPRRGKVVVQGAYGSGLEGDDEGAERQGMAPGDVVGVETGLG